MKRITALLPLLTFLAAAESPAQQLPVAPSPAPSEPGVNPQLLVATGWLAARLDDPAVVVLQVGRDEADYRAGHVPGARFLPLSAIVVERDGLPNELPEAGALQAAFQQVGVSDGSHVVLYGDLGGLAAGRAFFTLEYLGHDRISLLDGGLEVWKAEGRPLSTQPPAVQLGSFTPRPRSDRLVTADWVRGHLDDPGVVLIDARPPAEYTGEQPGAGIERPGHIPGAKNLFWRTALRSEQDPRLRDPEALRALFTTAGARPGRTIVAYCRTGVQASHLYFVARYLGYDVRMYDGSFAEWSRRAELPVER